MSHSKQRDRYDLYRPGHGRQNDQYSPRSSDTDRSGDAGFRPMDPPEDRRGRRPPLDTMSTERNESLTNLNARHENPPTKINPGIPFVATMNPNLTHSIASTSSHPPTNSTEARQQAGTVHRSHDLGNAEVSRSSVGPSKTQDPRLRLKAQNNMAAQLSASPQEPLSANHPSDEQSEMDLINELVTIQTTRLSEEKDAKQLQARMKKLNDQIRDIRRHFPDGNPYTKSLREEYNDHGNRLAQHHIRIEDLNLKEAAKKPVFDRRLRRMGSLEAELKEVKNNLAQKNKSMQELENSNFQLQERLASFDELVNSLKRQVTTVSESLEETKTALKNNKDNFDSADNGVDNLKQHMLGPSSHGINGRPLLTDGDIEDVSSRVEKLSNTVSDLLAHAHVPSTEVVTRSQLNDYVTRFNRFETETGHRFLVLESQHDVNLQDIRTRAKEGDLTKYVQDLAAQQEVHNTMKHQLSKLEGDTKFLHDLVNSCMDKSVQMEEKVNALARPTDDLPLHAEEKMRQHWADDLSAVRKEAQKLQAEHGTIHNNLLIMERTFKAHAHSITSLNQRFNNLSTEQLARQMVTSLEPMLATVKPKIEDISAQMEKMEQIPGQLEVLNSSLSDHTTATETRITAMQQAINNVTEASDKWHDSLTDLQRQLEKMVKTYTEGQKGLGDDFDLIRNGLETIKSSSDQSYLKKDDFLVAITDVEARLEKLHDQGEVNRKLLDTTNSSTTQEIETKFSNLIRQVQEARDGIDQRFVAVETKISAVGMSVRDNQDSMEVEEPKHPSKPTVQLRKPVTSTVSSVESSPQSSRTAKQTTIQTLFKAKDASTKAQSDKPTLPSVPHLGKHFKPSTMFLDDDDLMGDTIDATPKSRRSVSGQTARKPESTVPDSESEETGEQISEAIDFAKWQKNGSAQQNAKGGGKPSASKTDGKSGSAARASVDGASAQAKRKRDLSQTVPKSASASTGSETSTPHSSQPSKKKAKTTKKAKN